MLWRALGFGDVPEAHRLMHENRHIVGKISIMVGATDEEQGRSAEGPGAIRVGLESPCVRTPRATRPARLRWPL